MERQTKAENEANHLAEVEKRQQALEDMYKGERRRYEQDVREIREQLGKQFEAEKRLLTEELKSLHDVNTVKGTHVGKLESDVEEDLVPSAIKKLEEKQKEALDNITKLIHEDFRSISAQFEKGEQERSRRLVGCYETHSS